MGTESCLFNSPLCSRQLHSTSYMVGPQQNISGVTESLHVNLYSITNQRTDLELDNGQMISNAANAECGWIFNQGLCQTVRIIETYIAYLLSSLISHLYQIPLFSTTGVPNTAPPPSAPVPHRLVRVCGLLGMGLHSRR